MHLPCLTPAVPPTQAPTSAVGFRIAVAKWLVLVRLGLLPRLYV